MNQLSGHLWNAVLLLVSVTVAVAAERFATSSSRPPVSGASAPDDGRDITDFVVPAGSIPAPAPQRVYVPVDPFGRRQSDASDFAVAPERGTPTLSSSSTHRLTAILIADDRRVAVIDESAVSVGTMLVDGSRVASIQSDRVHVVDKNGRWRILTLTNRGQ